MLSKVEISNDNGRIGLVTKTKLPALLPESCCDTQARHLCWQ
jgi:hypothetical protein